MNKTPAISVGMPVYNGEKYIAKSIESILNQTFGDFELLISDNASTDHTESICREYAKKDERISYFRNEKNVGAGPNYNILFGKARAPYFRWHNADDLITPDAHKLCLQTLEQNPQAVLCYGKTKIIDGAGNHLSDYDDNLHITDSAIYDRFVKFNSIVGMTNAIYGLMRSDALRKTRLFGNFMASDTVFMGELIMYGTFIEIPEQLFFRRMHEDAMSWDPDQREKDFWDPSSSHFYFQLIKQHVFYYSASLQADIPINEKIKILKYLVKRSYWKKADLWRDLIYPLKQKIKGKK